MKKMYLVDVSSMFFRAFYAIRPLSAPNGLPVNAIYGFLSMLVKLLKDERPDYVVFCYDRKEPSFRKELYDDYKANRTEMPEDLAKQIPYIKKLAELLGIPALEIAPYEADDIIGTLAKLSVKKGVEAIIVSGDKDFGQIIEPGILLFDTMKDVKYDSQGVKEKWGVMPAQFIDYLALVGDSSDNVPGVAGIGPKGAIKLLEQFGSLEEIYKNLDQVSGASLKDKLEKSKEMAFLSKKLVTIACDVPLSDELDSYKMKPVQREDLHLFLQELNFKSFEKSLLGEGGVFEKNAKEISRSSSSEQSNSKVEVVADTNLFAPLTNGLPALYEWTEVEAVSDFDKSASLWVTSFQDRWALFQNGKFYFAVEWTSDLKQQLQQFRFSAYDLKTIWHQMDWDGPYYADWDTMLAAYALKSEDWTDSTKAFLKFLDFEIPEIAKIETLMDAHLHLAQKIKAELEPRHGLSVYQDIELRSMPVLYKMERVGIKVDAEFLKKQSEEMAIEIFDLEREIKQLTGHDFNVASPKQLGVILFEKMGLPAGKKTKTGYSTDNEVLESLDHPVAKKILNYRELTKLKSTYVDAIPLLISKKDGRVHTTFNQAVTTTGRLSSTNPNLQNIPIRTPRGQQVRASFIAEGNNFLMSADYSQIELRILAHISQDPGLCRAFADDLDIHAATASEVFAIPLANVSSEQRRIAKAVNFGIAYGQGAFGLAETLGISRSEAQSIIKNYFEKFKGVQDYIEETIKSAYEKGYVETLFGRRRYIEELQSKNPMLKKFGERAAINAPIQGTAADLVKKAMIHIDDQVKIPMLLQVHDELVFESDKSTLEESAALIVKVMESVTNLRVPLKVNYAISKSWEH